MRFHDIELEGDAIGIVKKLQRFGGDLSLSGTLIAEARSKAANFYSCVFMHSGRNGNMVAHSLAKYGLGVHEETIWVEECPSFAQEYVNIDDTFP
ncbi:hypothetical protein CRYUN_Cryun17cG0062000 [Craigia yunnanensis]